MVLPAPRLLQYLNLHLMQPRRVGGAYHRQQLHENNKNKAIINNFEEIKKSPHFLWFE